MDFLWFLHGLRTPFLTALFQIITLFGEEIIIVGTLCVLYWCVRRELALGACISFFLSALIVQGIKVIVRVDRPWLLDPAFEPVWAAVGTATGYSFPSGHTQSAVAVFGYLGLATRKKGLRAALWGLALLVGVSRMYLGMHTPLDVLGAIVITGAIVAATWAYLRANGPALAIPAVLAALSAAVLWLALSLHGQGLIEAHYASDCCKAAGGCLGCAIGYAWAKRAIPFQPQAGGPWAQALKLLVGIAGLLALKSGVKLLVGESLLIDTLRYGLIALWALALYPLLFSRLLQKRTS